MQGVVQKFDQTKNGKPFVKIDGKDYFFGRNVNPDGAKEGQKVEFEYEEFGEARGRWGRPRALKDWRPVLNGSGQPQTGSTITDLNYLQSVSNIVGHACAAGSIKTAEELEKWCIAARFGLSQAMSRAKINKSDEPEQDFDDEIPF